MQNSIIEIQFDAELSHKHTKAVSKYIKVTSNNVSFLM